MRLNRHDILKYAGAAAASIALSMYGCSKTDAPTESKQLGLEKKIFIYTQSLTSTKNDELVLQSSDFWIPHLYDLSFDRTYESRDTGKKKTVKKKIKGKWKNVSEPIYTDVLVKTTPHLTNRASQKSIDNFVDKSGELYITPMLGVQNTEDIKELLLDPKKYVSLIADEIKRKGFDGITVDIERETIGKEYSRQLVSFMEELRRQLPTKDYTISIAVSPRFKGSEKNYPHHAFYDYNSLEKHVDYIHLMCYDFHKGVKGNTPRPVLSDSELKKVLDYAVETIPKEKTVVLLPFYGGQWTVKDVLVGKGKKRHTEQAFSKPKALSADYQSRNMSNFNIKNKTYDNGELRIETKDGKIIYGQDEKVFSDRLKILDAYNVPGVGGWRQSHASTEILETYKGWKPSTYNLGAFFNRLFGAKLF